MNSFNVYGQTSETIGGNTPVWLGTVKPIPVWAIAPGGMVIKAGTAGIYYPSAKEFSPVEKITVDNISRCNAFLYNDVVDDSSNPGEATCAVVMHHPEGLLIERVYPEITEEQIAALQARIPGVLLVRG